MSSYCGGHIIKISTFYVFFWLFVAGFIDVILGSYENYNRHERFHNARRIIGGENSEGRSFMVYLLKAEESKANYSDWLCGGTLVKDDFILTSAACVKDVEFVYVMAGTQQYIKNNDDKRMDDDCLKCMRKKVIDMFFPDDYEISFEDTVQWSTNDIALLQVESPFSKCPFEIRGGCDYRPWPIQIDVDNEEHQNKQFTLGWGSDLSYRQSGIDEDKDVNSPILKETQVNVVSTEACQQAWGKKWRSVIKNSMICTLDKDGEQREKNESKPSKSTQTDFKHRSSSRIEDSTPYAKIDRRRRNRDAIAHTARDHSTNAVHSLRTRFAKKAGFCQNDHGGPLVDMKENGQLVVVGVASACRITNTMKCVGPFLYTSTYKHRCFLMKALDMGTGHPCARRRYRRYKKRHISWINHPDGPADNERNITRF